MWTQEVTQLCGQSERKFISPARCPDRDESLSSAFIIMSRIRSSRACSINANKLVRMSTVLGTKHRAKWFILFQHTWWTGSLSNEVNKHVHQNLTFLRFDSRSSVGHSILLPCKVSLLPAWRHLLCQRWADRENIDLAWPLLFVYFSPQSKPQHE